MHTLTYFDRRVKDTGLMYQLKPGVATPHPDGTERTFIAFVSEQDDVARVGINQPTMPHNPTLPADAWQELAGLLDDWNEHKALMAQSAATV